MTELWKRLRTRHHVRVLALRGNGQSAPQGYEDVRIVVPAPRAQVRGVQKAWCFALAWARARPGGVDPSIESLREPLQAELESFRPDVVHVTGGTLAGLGDELEGHASVLAPLDAEHLNADASAWAAGGSRRLAWKHEARLMRRFERRTYGRFDHIVVVTPQDATALARLDPRLHATVIPNGVDAERYAYDGTTERQANRVLFTGNLDHAPNVTAAEFLALEVMPRVRAALPGARLALVGRNPDRTVRLLAESGCVDLVGEVEDMTAWLSSSRVYACAMLTGTGIKNKLLEAMANGLACVVTPLSLQGLSAEPGKDLLVASDAAKYAEELVRVLREPRLAEEVGRAGRQYVLEHHSWDAVAARYEQLYAEAAETARVPKTG